MPASKGRYTTVFESEFMDELANLKRTYKSTPYDVAGHFVATTITLGGRSLSTSSEVPTRSGKSPPFFHDHGSPTGI